MSTIRSIDMATRFSEHIKVGLDSNDTGAVTGSLDMKENGFVSWTVQATSGAHTTHVITLQHSLDNAAWLDTSSEITGAGTAEDNVQTTARFVRAKVSTVEGAASKVDVIIQAK